MNIPILELTNINLALPNFSLNAIDLSIYPGEVHVLMGENGSGKSLIMQVVNGTLRPDSGTIHFYGNTIPYKSYTSLAEKEVLYVGQNLALWEHLSVAENLFFGNMPYKNKWLKTIDYECLNSQFQKIVDEFKLPISLYDHVSLLGTAQKQMLQFCKAYISNARIVILDEPADTLTSVEKEVLYHIVEKIRDRGTAVFFITHHINDLFRIGDRITLLRAGTTLCSMYVKDTHPSEIIQTLSNIPIKDKYPKIRLQKGKDLIKVSDLGFKNKLENINFRLREGEILGITGMAGSGRTLLAKCLFGAVKHTGTIKIQGQTISISSPEIAIKNGIAFMPDNRLEDSFFQYFNTDENIAFPSLHRFSKNKVIHSSYLEQTVYQYIQKANIPAEINKKISSYSGGSLQKVLFIKWLMSRAKIFILDEPTHGIDLASKIDIYNFITDMVKKKVGIIFISSDIEEILGICDRVAVLSDQTFVCDIPTSQITAEEIIKLSTSEK